MIETNKIYTESNLDTMARMPDNCIDLTVTSPPYDDLRNYKGYSFDFEATAKELFRITKKGGVVVWVVGDKTINGSETGTSFRQALYFKEIGFNLHDTMIYEKLNPVPLNHNRYEQAFEFMFVFSKGKPKTFNPILEKCKFAGKHISKKRKFYQTSDDTTSLGHKNDVTNDFKIRKNIFTYSLFGGKSKISNSAVFPEQLAADHIKTWTNEGELVYDCFGGSCTTAKMAILLNRNWIVSEISREYSDLGAERIKPYQSSTLFQNGFEKTEGSVGEKNKIQSDAA